jgi:hypothetical protein
VIRGGGGGELSKRVMVYLIRDVNTDGLALKFHNWQGKFHRFTKVNFALSLQLFASEIQLIIY